MSEPKVDTITIELSPATSYLVKSMFTQSRERGEQDTRYMKEADGFVEVLLDFAIRRKKSEWTSHDKVAVGTALRKALDKVVNGQPLNNEETKLVAAFRQAANAPA